MGRVTGMAITPDQSRLVTACDSEQTLKLFDTLNFDVIHFIKLGFAPGECDFVSKINSFSPVLAVAELPSADGLETTGLIRLVKVEQVSTKHDQNQVVSSTIIRGLHES